VSFGRAERRQSRVWAAAGAGLCLAGFACRGGRWIIAGESIREPPSDAGTLPRIDASVAPEICPSAALLDRQRDAAYPASSLDARHLGLWRGSLRGAAVEGFPSADVELTIAASGQGSLRFGAPAAAPSGLDPTQGYLCTQRADAVQCATPSGFVGGFVYPLEGVTSRGDVLSFVIVGADPWDAWCRLQAPLARPEPAQPCGYSFGAGPAGSDSIGANGCARLAADETSTPIDCELMYALQRCRCGTDACVADYVGGSEVGLRLSGGLLVGSLWYAGDVDAAPLSLARQ
jgi:hypothetical protein